MLSEWSARVSIEYSFYIDNMPHLTINTIEQTFHRLYCLSMIFYKNAFT